MYIFALLKVHTLYAEDHLELRLRATGESLAKGCCQGLEGTHSGLRRSDRVHGCHIVHSQVSKFTWTAEN